MLLGMPGGFELFVILIVGLLIFGGRLPEVARSIGRGLQEFRGGLRELDREVGSPIREAMRGTPPAEPPQAPAVRLPEEGEPLPHDEPARDDDAAPPPAG
jgi:TatA/E family protein of Tat protein translocase